MTKKQVLAAADVRLARGENEVRRAALMLHLTTRMDDTQTIADAWTAEELTQLEATFAVKLTVRRVKVAPPAMMEAAD